MSCMKNLRDIAKNGSKGEDPPPARIQDTPLTDGATSGDAPSHTDVLPWPKTNTLGFDGAALENPGGGKPFKKLK